MKILFCYQSSGKSIYFESLTHQFLKQGIEVEALFFCESGHLQRVLEAEGVKCFNYTAQSTRFIPKVYSNVRYLIEISRRTKPDYLFSHLVNANLYASIATYFLFKIKVVVCRHHADEFYQSPNKKAIVLDRIINFFAPKILVISQKAYQHLIKVEHVPQRKIGFIPLAYNFERYDRDKQEAVESRKSDTAVRFIAICRLVDIKRIDAFFPVIQHFKTKNIRIEIQIIGDGPLEKDLKTQAKQLNIADLVTFLGFKENVIPYIQAADLLLHLSVSESSNQVVKEAGYCKKTVIACRSVGDFDDYLNDENAYLVDKNFTTSALILMVEKLLSNRFEIEQKGEKLHQTVMDTFSLNDSILNQYLAYFA